MKKQVELREQPKFSVMFVYLDGRVNTNKEDSISFSSYEQASSFCETRNKTLAKLAGCELGRCEVFLAETKTTFTLM